MNLLNMLLLHLCLLVHVVAESSVRYDTFQDLIPNGDKITVACSRDIPWPAVGYKDPSGGGPLNVFGEDFNRAGRRWTKDLCERDSDGDGRTNGQELGDRECTWTVGSTPSRTDMLSHPGVYDPVTDELCSELESTGSDTRSMSELCPFVNDNDVKTLDIAFNDVSIPADPTTYLCIFLEIPSDQKYMVVAFEPIPDKDNVIHHMSLYGCDKSFSPAVLGKPEVCSMNFLGPCTYYMKTWTEKSQTTCNSEGIGSFIGKDSARIVRLEAHYNNPQRLSGVRDSSGIRVYYRPVRPTDNSLGVFMTGQLVLDIPAGQESVEAVGVCPSDCTRTLIKQPAKIVNAVNHMHLIGKSMKVQVFRNNSKIADLAIDMKYTFHNVSPHTLDPPFVLLPGDEIVTTCVYNNSLSTDRCLHFAKETSDEMCIAFITFYPREAISADHCVAGASASACTFFNGESIGDCNWASIKEIPKRVMRMFNLMMSCAPDGECRRLCCNTLRRIMKHPCYQGETFKIISVFLNNFPSMRPVYDRIYSCSSENATTCELDLLSQCPTIKN